MYVISRPAMAMCVISRPDMVMCVIPHLDMAVCVCDFSSGHGDVVPRLEMIMYVIPCPGMIT